MESSTSKVEMLKPVLLKAGIPLALSVAGFIYARILAQRSTHSKESLFESDQVSSLETNSQESRDEDNFHSFSCTCTLTMEESLEINDYKPKLEEEISRLRSRLEDLQKRESELEMEFISYCDMKERESALMELRNTLLLEMARVEFMDREVSFMEAESHRLEELVEEYLKVLEQFEEWKSENELLQRQVKMLMTQASVQASIIREQDLKLEAREAEVGRVHDELETRKTVTKTLEDEIGELRMILDQLQDEKKGLLEKLELKENSASSISEIEGERIKIEDHTRLSEELEQLQKDRAAEHMELINLRWSNACLRHELMKNNAQQEHGNEQKNSHLETDSEVSIEIGNYGLEQELAVGMALEHNVNEPCLGNVSTDQACSKRHKLFRRLRRWVEGSDQNGRRRLEEKERHEEAVKCFGRHSVSDDAQEHHHTRRSCSSA
ncbi:protein CHUP1, chloroplastic [Rosa rugosa]|uniref:protein CHUP1, chloroplastic n=1 Tax=Rosa rugosa TaxID=74645 RepID=UPI002B40A00C|nr:protein CHUP1, chloroplastic [Rosa rugosa]